MRGEPRLSDLPERVWFLCLCENDHGQVRAIQLWKCGPFARGEVPTALRVVFEERPETDLCYLCDHEPDVAVAEKCVLTGESIVELPWVLVLCVNEARRAMKREMGEN